MQFKTKIKENQIVRKQIQTHTSHKHKQVI